MRMKLLAAALFSASLVGCSTTYTVDDGRKVDEKLLGQIRTYADGEQALRPAVVRSADLHDPKCSHQWELPFEAKTTYPIGDKDTKVAWVRGAGIDEHLKVIATSPAIDLAVGDTIVSVDGYETTNSTKLLKELLSDRDDGKPFDIKTASGRTVKVTPLQVCRGRVVLGEPGKAADEQHYHWLQVYQPLQIASIHLSPDEAAYVVLWTQGLSEEASGRMRVYKVGMGIVRTVGELAITAATVVTAGAAGAAAATSAAAAGATAGAIASQMALAEAPRIALGAASSIATAAAGNTATLWGIDWVASTGFDLADQWAFERMSKLGMDPATGTELQQRLAAAGDTRNAFLLDKSRQEKMATLMAGLPPGQQPGAELPGAGTPLQVEAQTVAPADSSEAPQSAGSSAAPTTTATAPSADVVPTPGLAPTVLPADDAAAPATSSDHAAAQQPSASVVTQ